MIFAQTYWFKWESNQLKAANASLATELEMTRGKWTDVGYILAKERGHLVESIIKHELSLSESYDELIGLIYSINRVADDMIQHGPEKFKNMICRPCDPMPGYEDIVRNDAEQVEAMIADFLNQKIIHRYYSDEEFVRISRRHDKINGKLHQSIDFVFRKEELTSFDWAQFESDINLWGLSLLNELTDFFGHTLYCFPRYQLVSRTVETNAENGMTKLALSIDMADVFHRKGHMDLCINGELIEQNEDGYWYKEIPTENLTHIDSWNVDFTYLNPLTGEAGESGMLWKSVALAEIRRVE
ncbi:MAG: hypothetical protein AAFY91_17910 [Bacteroidota bacterium]